jgi:hypothetical protein
MSFSFKNPALVSTVIVGAAWAAFWLPTKAFHASGAPPAGYLTSVGFHALLPGEVVLLFVYWPSGDSPIELTLWNLVLIGLNWAFYFGVLVGVGRLRRRRPS